MEYLTLIGLFLDIVGFTLVFWKGDFFSARTFSGVGPPPAWYGRSGDQFLQVAGEPSTERDDKRWRKGRYDRWLGLVGAILVVFGFGLQSVPHTIKLLC